MSQPPSHCSKPNCHQANCHQLYPTIKGPEKFIGIKILGFTHLNANTYSVELPQHPWLTCQGDSMMFSAMQIMSILEYNLAVQQSTPKQLEALKETHMEGLPMPAGYIKMAMALDHQNMDPQGLSGICPT